MANPYVPDAANWINAYEAGSAASMTRKKQQATSTAGRLMTGGDYAGASAALMPYDLSVGLQLQKYGEEEGRRKQRADVFTKYQTDPQAAQADALQTGDEDTINMVLELREKADERTLKEVALKQDNATKLLLALQDRPEAERQALAPQIAARLGLSPEDLVGVDFSDAGLPGELALSMKSADLLNFRDKERDNKRADAQAAETARHNRASEGQGAARLGLSQDANARGWAAHRARQAQGGYGPAAVLPPEFEVDN